MSITFERSRPVVEEQLGPPAESAFRPALRDVPSWMISLAAHLSVLYALYNLTLTITVEHDSPIITSIEELDPDQFKIDNAAVVDLVGSDSSLHELDLSQAVATEVGETPQRQMDRQLEEELLSVEVPTFEPIDEPHEAELLEVVNTTGATEHPGGVAGAIDRLTLEIAGSLRENKTLVVWLFDVSPSVSKRRNEIADRFANVYRQLGLLEVGGGDSLKTAVAAFGAQTYFVTDNPVDDAREVVTAIREIAADQTGDENVFTAVGSVAKRWSSYRTRQHRNMMIIVVTDEAGSDQERLEETLLYCKRYGMRCYVVGNAAPFGRRKVTMPFELDNGDVVIAEAEPGPESVYPERLQLPFWGGIGSSLENLSSGFGPYALTRLCAETNGIYFVTADNSTWQFDAAVMRNYAPDYLPVKKYEAVVSRNRTKAALMNASMLSWRDGVPRPQLSFRAPNDNELRKSLTEAQRPIAKLDARLDEMMAILMTGEPSREKLGDIRWRAGYDLAMGRVLAMRARAFGYNVTLAEMKSSPKTFQTKGNNAWRLAPSREITSGPSVNKLAEKSAAYLTRVIDQHPGTPWALLAERELAQPMGWEWREFRVEIRSENNRQPRDNQQAERDDRDRRRRREPSAGKPIKI